MLLGHIVGWPFPRGGVGALTDALVGRLLELGGGVVCGARVTQILVAGRRVRGVRLASGETIAGDAVLSTLSAAPLAALLPSGALRLGLTGRLQRWRYGVGTFKVDFALDGPVLWTNLDARRAGVVHLGDRLEALFGATREAGGGHVRAPPTMVVGQDAVHDPSRAPAGKHAPVGLHARCAASRPERRRPLPTGSRSGSRPSLPALASSSLLAPCALRAIWSSSTRGSWVGTSQAGAWCLISSSAYAGRPSCLAVGQPSAACTSRVPPCTPGGGGTA
jgi:phytoene dehydrogenase-like protein